MAVDKNIILGVLAIILGIFVIAFPWFSIFTLSIFAGFAVIFLGIWLLSQILGTWNQNKALGAAFLILGIIAIIGGIGLFGSVLALSFLAGFWLYFSGFFLIISGVMSFFIKEGNVGKGAGVLGILLGILYIILAPILIDPRYLALFIGIWLIIDGVAALFVDPSELMKTEEPKAPE